MSFLRRLGGALAMRARYWAGSENRAAAILVILGFVLVVAAILVARYIALEVMAKETQAFDEEFLKRLHAAKERFGERRIFVDHLMQDITALGGVAALTLLTIFTTAYLFLARRPREAVLTLVAAIGASAINAGLKNIFERPRPQLWDRPIEFSHSFPSGHSMSSMAIYLTLGVMLARLAPTWSARIFTTVAVVFMSLMVAFSRMYLGVHYPTDVTAGALLGLAWALVVLSADEVFRRERLMRRAMAGLASAAGAPAATIDATSPPESTPPDKDSNPEAGPEPA
jgi:undecaprenyl-diphosphatase